MIQQDSPTDCPKPPSATLCSNSFPQQFLSDKDFLSPGCRTKHLIIGKRFKRVGRTPQGRCYTCRKASGNSSLRPAVEGLLHASWNTSFTFPRTLHHFSLWTARCWVQPDAYKCGYGSIRRQRRQ